ncbi:MAG: A24 family peptidase [Bacillota bacterium]
MDLILGLILVIPLYLDLKKGIIPNWFILLLTSAGLIINLYLRGLSGLLYSISGFGLGLFLFLLPFILGGLGAGDVKLVAAIGAVKGARFIFLDVLIIAVIGGLLAVLKLIRENNLGKITDLINKFIYRLPLDDLSQKKSSNVFPYGVAIVIGTWCYLVLNSLNILPR